jgi:putative membrane protein
MSVLRSIASVSLALLLGAGAAFAQNTGDDSANPHSTANKDRPAGSADPARVDAAEAGNSNSVRSKDKVGTAVKPDTDAAEANNPHSVMDKDSKDAWSHGSMKDGAMMKGPATASAVLERLSVADQGEVKMGQLAQANGTARAQDYGKMLQQDHQASLDQVKALAQKKGVAISDSPKDGMARHEQHEAMEMHQKLAAMHGADFDKAFAKMMVDDHQKDIDHLKSWRTSVKDEDVTALIDQTLPVLQKHLDAAKRLQTPMAQGRSPATR